MKKAKKTLPDKPSELLRLALQDLDVASAAGNVIIDMERWHEARFDGCYMCLAGSVMRETLGKSDKDLVSPDDFTSEVRRKLFAIDSFRTGSVHGGLEYLGYQINIERRQWANRFHDMIDYHEDEQEWRRNMEEMVEAMEAHGY